MQCFNIKSAYVACTFLSCFISAAFGQSDDNWDNEFFSFQDVNGPVTSLYAHDSVTVYIGGYFANSNRVPNASFIIKARRDPDDTLTTWVALDSGVNSWVDAITIQGSNVYVGGAFNSTNTESSSRIARWDGSAWHSLGNGVNGQVLGIATRDTNVYVVGDFDTAGGIRCQSIAKWNGTSWSSLGTGVNGYINALCIRDSNIYIGGAFDTAGSVSARNVAKWNGTSWSALGGGANKEVLCILRIDSNIFFGGKFDTLGTTIANNVGRWNGISWLSLGSGSANGTDGPVYSLANIGTKVFVGGTFSRAGGDPCANVARWYGNEWSGLGSGLDGLVSALATTGNSLFVGGSFSHAGTFFKNFLAKWSEPDSTLQTIIDRLDDQVTILPYPQPATNRIHVSLELDDLKKVNIEIMDQQGKIVKLYSNFRLEAGENNLSLNLTDLPAGQYYLKIESKKRSFTKKIILTK